MSDRNIIAEALRRFPWAFPPESDKDDERDRIKNERRVAQGKKPKEPRDWKITRDAIFEQIRQEREIDRRKSLITSRDGVPTSAGQRSGLSPSRIEPS